MATLATPATSPSLAALIERIIADAGQDAEVHFGAGQPGVLGGAFPGPRDLTGSTFQRIDLGDMEAFEAGAPGYGTAALAHEIAETYEAHAHLPAVPATDLFPSAHAAGLQAENAVLADVVGPGERVATRIALDASGSRIVTFDFENYFMIDEARWPASCGGCPGYAPRGGALPLQLRQRGHTQSGHTTRTDGCAPPSRDVGNRPR